VKIKMHRPDISDIFMSLIHPEPDKLPPMIDVSNR